MTAFASTFPGGRCSKSSPFRATCTATNPGLPAGDTGHVSTARLQQAGRGVRPEPALGQLRRVRQREMHRHVRSSRVRQLRRRRGVHPQSSWYRNFVSPVVKSLVRRDLHRVSSPLLRWRWHCSGRHALHRRGPSPHPVGLYRAHFTLESVRVGEISSRDGQHRPTHRVTHSRRDRREDRPRGVLKLDVREELAERANRVGHVYAHRLFAIIRSLATYQGRRCEMRRDGSLPDATQIRRLQVVTSHLQHRPRRR